MKIGLHYEEMHKVHKAWFEESLDDTVTLERPETSGIQNIFHYLKKSFEIGDPDTIVCEDVFSVRVGLLYKIRNPSTRVYTLACSEEYYQPQLEQKFHFLLDGIIANSSFIASEARKFCEPVEVATPFVHNMEKYTSVEKNYSKSNTVVFVGRNSTAKNIGALIEAVKQTDYSLDIVGEGFDDYGNSINSVGYQENIIPYLENADLYIHPAKGESFGVAPVESMLTATPTIISTESGSSFLVDEKMKCKPEPNSIRQKIEWFDSLDRSDRRRIGLKQRKNAIDFGVDRKSSVREFRKAIKYLSNQR